MVYGNGHGKHMIWDVILLVPMNEVKKGIAIFYFFGSLKIA